jgi:hypothetical protein
MQPIKPISAILNIALWIAQGLLSAMLLWAAYTKLFTPADKLAAMWPWTAQNRKLVIFTAILDALGGIGLVLPGLPGVAPAITVYAAIGTFLLMIAAIIFHVSRGEARQIGINIVVAAICIFIAWGRR